jgi:hypothetical protein
MRLMSVRQELINTTEEVALHTKIGTELYLKTSATLTKQLIVWLPDIAEAVFTRVLTEQSSVIAQTYCAFK